MWHKATAAGDAEAPFYLAWSYAHGADGCPKDPEESWRLLSLSASRGFKKAQEIAAQRQAAAAE